LFGRRKFVYLGKSLFACEEEVFVFTQEDCLPGKKFVYLGRSLLGKKKFVYLGGSLFTWEEVCLLERKFVTTEEEVCLQGRNKFVYLGIFFLPERKFAYLGGGSSFTWEEVCLPGKRFFFCLGRESLFTYEEEVVYLGELFTCEEEVVYLGGLFTCEEEAVYLGGYLGRCVFTWEEFFFYLRGIFFYLNVSSPVRKKINYLGFVFFSPESLLSWKEVVCLPVRKFIREEKVYKPRRKSVYHVGSLFTCKDSFFFFFFLGVG
jgi:hypothetical protein